MSAFGQRVPKIFFRKNVHVRTPTKFAGVSYLPKEKRLSPPTEFESFLLAQKLAIVDPLRTLDVGNSVAEDAQQCSQKTGKSYRSRIYVRYDVLNIS